MVRAVFVNVLEVLAHKGAIYCWHAHKRCGDIQRIWRDLGVLDHQQIIWVKPTPVFGRVYWHFRHEPCVMGWRQGDKPEHDGVHEHDSVWEADWDGKARSVGSSHPTSKPTELFVRPIKKHTSVGAIVFEPFSGSGSQLIRTHGPPLSRHRDQRALRGRRDPALAEGDRTAGHARRRRQVVHRSRDRARLEHRGGVIACHRSASTAAHPPGTPAPAAPPTDTADGPAAACQAHAERAVGSAIGVSLRRHRRQPHRCARMLGVSQPRLTHLMALRLLCPDIQAAILLDELKFGDKELRALARVADWDDQKAMVASRDGGPRLRRLGG
ncbi:MAG: DNA methyltransferase [Planctomycetota bacterium]